MALSTDMDRACFWLMFSFSFPFIDLQGMPVGPSLQPAQVPLDGSTSTCQQLFPVLYIIKFAEGALCHTGQVMNEELSRGGGGNG